MEPKLCPVCEGVGEKPKGFYPDKSTRCKACHGSGYVIVQGEQQFIPMPYPVYPPVPIYPRWYPQVGPYTTITTATPLPVREYTAWSTSNKTAYDDGVLSIGD